MKKLNVLVIIGTALVFSMVSCVDKSKYEPTYGFNDDEAALKVPNSFDFSTVQKVNLSVDYSAYKTYGPVFFGVYTKNPFIIIEKSANTCDLIALRGA